MAESGGNVTREAHPHLSPYRELRRGANSGEQNRQGVLVKIGPIPLKAWWVL